MIAHQPADTAAPTHHISFPRERDAEILIIETTTVMATMLIAVTTDTVKIGEVQADPRAGIINTVVQKATTGECTNSSRKSVLA